jgi:hypothetical protein
MTNQSAPVELSVLFRVRVAIVCSTAGRLRLFMDSCEDGSLASPFMDVTGLGSLGERAADLVTYRVRGAKVGKPTMMSGYDRLDSGVETAHVFSPLYMVPVAFPGDTRLRINSNWTCFSKLSGQAGDVAEKVLAQLKIRLAGDFVRMSAQLVFNKWTVRDLRLVHEAVTGMSFDQSNFRRRVKVMVGTGEVEDLGEKRPTTTKPAKLYRFRI